MDIKQIKIEVLENLIAKLQAEVDALKGAVTASDAPGGGHTGPPAGPHA